MIWWLTALALAGDPKAPAPKPTVVAVAACKQWEISMYQLDCNGGLKGLPWWGRKDRDRRTCELPEGWEPFTAGGLVTGGSEVMGNVTQPYIVMRRCMKTE